MWEELNARLMALDDADRERALALLLEVLDFIEKYPEGLAPGDRF